MTAAPTVAPGHGAASGAAAVAVTAPAGLADVIGGPVRRGRVLVASPRVAQLLLDDEPGRTVVVLAGRGGVALPNTLLCTVDPTPLHQVRSGQAVAVGDGAVRVGRDLTLRVARWRDHRVRLPDVDAIAVAARLAAAPPAPAVAPPFVDAFAALLATAPTGDPDPTALLGLGPGSTPEGDDLVAGLLAGCVVLAPDVAAAGPVLVWAERLAAASTAAASTATTALSASLLEHAARGEVVTEAAAVLRAFVGRGDLTTAEDALAALGHTSGRALVTGLRAAAMLVTATAAGAVGSDGVEVG